MEEEREGELREMERERKGGRETGVTVAQLVRAQLQGPGGSPSDPMSPGMKG